MTLDGPVDAGDLAVDDVSWPHPNGAAAHASPTRLSTAILGKIPRILCIPFSTVLESISQVDRDIAKPISRGSRCED